MKYFVILSVVWQLAQSAALPDYLKNGCKRNDPEFAKCMMRQFQSHRETWINGVPELGIPALDPFKMPELIINRTIADMANVYAVITNIKVVGGSNFIVDDFKADPVNLYGEVRVTLPLVDVEVDYDIDGDILGVPIKNKGHFYGTFNTIQAFIKISFKYYTKEGEQYFKVNKLDTKVSLGNGKIKLISEDKEFQQTVDFAANIFNNNPRAIMDMLNPVMVETANDIFRQMWDHFLGVLPASEWFPE